MNIHDATEIAYKNGYEQAVRDIFAEIENAHEECIHIDATTNLGYLLKTKFMDKLAELKKKYIGEGEE